MMREEDAGFCSEKQKQEDPRNAVVETFSCQTSERDASQLCIFFSFHGIPSSLFGGTGTTMAQGTACIMKTKRVLKKRTLLAFIPRSH